MTVLTTTIIEAGCGDHEDDSEETGSNRNNNARIAPVRHGQTTAFRHRQHSAIHANIRG